MKTRLRTLSLVGATAAGIVMAGIGTASATIPVESQEPATATGTTVAPVDGSAGCGDSSGSSGGSSVLLQSLITGSSGTH